LGRTLYMLILILVFGCGPPMTQNAVYDFIQELPQADRDFDLFVVDLSKPDHYQYLSEGWHIPNTTGISGTRFIWSSDKESRIKLISENKDEKELIITLQPYRFESAPPVTMKLYINDHPIGRISLKDEWRTYRLTIPAGCVQEGDNTLTAVQSHVFRPADVMVHSDDTRRLGASWSYVVFRDIQQPQSPGLYSLPQILGARNVTWTGQRRHVVFDTAPSCFSWPVTLPSRPALSFGIGFLPDLIERHGPNARFEITLDDETGTTHRLFRSELKPPKRLLEKGWTEYTRDLSSFAGQTVHITFETSSETTSEGYINSGSWLEPHIVNRHVDFNVFFLPIADYFDLNRIPIGTALESALVQADRTQSLPVPDKNENVVSGIPVEFIRTITSEGFWTGYFYSGYDPFENHQKARPVFRYTSGYEQIDTETYDVLSDDCRDWIKTLDKRRFMIVFDSAGWSPDSNLEYSELFRMLEWLLEYHFDKDSLIVIYGLKDASPVWILNPLDSSHNVMDISSWDELFHFIKADFLQL
jgi:hypothetical protein